MTDRAADPISSGVRHHPRIPGRGLLALLPLWIAGAALGYLGSSALSAAVGSLVAPLGASAAQYAIRDDRVALDVRRILAHRVGTLHLSEVAHGTVGVAIARDRTAVAVGLSSVRPEHLPGGQQEIWLLLGCGDDVESLGSLPERFYRGAFPQGWENALVITVPERCHSLIIAVTDARGELDSYGIVPVRSTPKPGGELARGQRP
ncbi:MAG: hypothetical protein RJQ01_10150 [Microcella sp.]|uniref:hypothetical protein n=1 Tax=Microcella sp. TaxID=1913979 RepID=UPI0033148986